MFFSFFAHRTKRSNQKTRKGRANILAKNRFEKSVIFVKIQQNDEKNENVAKSAKFCQFGAQVDDAQKDEAQKDESEEDDSDESEVDESQAAAAPTTGEPVETYVFFTLS